MPKSQTPLLVHPCPPPPRRLCPGLLPAETGPGRRQAAAPLPARGQDPPVGRGWGRATPAEGDQHAGHPHAVHQGRCPPSTDRDRLRERQTGYPGPYSHAGQVKKGPSEGVLVPDRNEHRGAEAHTGGQSLVWGQPESLLSACPTPGGGQRCLRRRGHCSGLRFQRHSSVYRRDRSPNARNALVFGRQCFVGKSSCWPSKSRLSPLRAKVRNGSQSLHIKLRAGHWSADRSPGVRGTRGETQQQGEGRTSRCSG